METVKNGPCLTICSKTREASSFQLRASSGSVTREARSWKLETRNSKLLKEMTHRFNLFLVALVSFGLLDGLWLGVLMGGF